MIFRTVHPIRSLTTRQRDFRKYGLRRYFVIYGEARVASCSSDWQKIRPSYYPGDDYYKYWYVYNRCCYTQVGATLIAIAIRLFRHRKYDYVFIKPLRTKHFYRPLVRGHKLDRDCVVEKHIEELR